MRLKILFAILTIGLSACQTRIKPPPPFSLGTAVFNGSLEDSYVKFFSFQDPGNTRKQFKHSSLEVFQKKDVCMTSDDYFALRRYEAYLRIEIPKIEEELKNCKQLKDSFGR
jgi:hypothetical protein